MDFRKKEGAAPGVPRQQPARPLAEGITSSPPPSMVRINGRILFVDDEKLVRSVGSRIFANAGNDVLLAENGRGALEAFRDNPDIALIILDFSLPDIRCTDILSALRSSGRDVKIIVCSGYPADQLGGMPEGADAWLDKPFTGASVFSAINTAFMGAP